MPEFFYATRFFYSRIFLRQKIFHGRNFFTSDKNAGLKKVVTIALRKIIFLKTPCKGRALSNVVTTQVVTEVIKKFVTNVNPAEFFRNGGNAKKLGVLFVKECQELLGPRKIFL